MRLRRYSGARAPRSEARRAGPVTGVEGPVITKSNPRLSDRIALLSSFHAPGAGIRRTTMILTEPKVQARFGRRVRQRALTAFLRQATTAVQLSGEVAVLLTSDAKIRRLNRAFRKKDAATDVLSFPAPEPVPGHPRSGGDLAISIETAARQAQEEGHALFTELKILLLHGVLHLAGYDHETDNGLMARREAVLRARFGLAAGLIERANSRSSADSGVRR